MAQKGKASSKTTVRRIKATDDAPKKEKAVAKKINKPIKITATWAMTAAVLIFTFAFVVLILLLDAAFNWGFNQILK